MLGMKILLVNNYIREREKISKLRSILEAVSRARVDVLGFGSLYKGWEGYDAIVLSGSQANISSDEKLKRFVREVRLVLEAEIPILGICFGHQLIGRAYGAGLVKAPRYYEGFYDIEVVDEDLIFRGMKGRIRLYESHRWFLDRVPDGFRLLARAMDYEVEAIAHVKRPIYGIQAHPERYDRYNMDGRRIIENFLSKSF